MLIFIGLFSAVVAQLLAISIQELQPNSQDTSAYYLAHIYQQISQSNGSRISIPSTLSDPTVPFTPPTSAIWVNCLWLSSLVMSFICALLAMLLQQWTRHYLRLAYPRYNPTTKHVFARFIQKGSRGHGYNGWSMRYQPYSICPSSSSLLAFLCSRPVSILPSSRL
ncbi:hypothetical protein BJV74DRAFT_54354 [Russula compacta]|nr:hypothetical protein BJV74DRAFT_54354 [Russula compacta]